MNKTLKKFAIAIMVAGATVTATRALAVEVLDTQVLDNISVTLKVYSQGPLKGTGAHAPTSLVATSTAFNTKDLIQQLAIISGFPFNAADKLVLSTLYSNTLIGSSGTVGTTNNLATNPLTSSGATQTTNVYVVGPVNTNELVMATSTATNTYLISNNLVIQYSSNAANTPPITTNANFLGGALASNVIYTVVATTATIPSATTLPGTDGTFTLFTNGPIQANVGVALGYWATIVPVFTTSTTNIVITQYTPVTNLLLTNVQGGVKTCLMTPKTGGTFTLYDVSDWVHLSPNDGNTIFAEGGDALTETNFAGTNITTQTAYSDADFNIKIVYGTNGTVANQTNIVFDPYGFSKATTKIQNLVTGGTKAEAQDFQITSTLDIDAVASGWIGGSFTANGGSGYTSLITGVTNTPTFAPGGNLFFANGSTFTTNTIYTNTISGVSVLVNGSVTLSFLDAGVAVNPTEP
jgi:hypothetical protein